MNHASDLEAAQKLPAQLIDALRAVEQSQTSPVILSDPSAVSRVGQPGGFVDGWTLVAAGVFYQLLWSRWNTGTTDSELWLLIA